MSSSTTLYDIFAEVDKAKTKPAKIATLHKYSDKNLKTFLGYVFDPNIQWTVPVGTPPYEPSKEDANLMRGRIWQEFRLIQHFTNTGPYPNMDKGKRENMFITLLQTLHTKDAELLCYVKDKRALPFKTVNKALISEAFPLLVVKWGEEPEGTKGKK